MSLYFARYVLTIKTAPMTKRDFWKYLTRAHKWAGLVLGVQVFLWIGSGLFMSLFPIHDVRGRHLAQQTDWSLSGAKVIPIELAMTLYEGELHGASLASYGGQPGYALIGDNGTQLINARTGHPWEPLGEAGVINAAKTYYKGSGTIKAAVKLSDAPPEYRRALPVWQVQFDDSAKTRLYIDPDTAQLNAVRTRLWRVYDFMWMLHIMDYPKEDNFNSWWLRLFAFMGFLFAISGLMLVFHRIWLWPRSKLLTKG